MLVSSKRKPPPVSAALYGLFFFIFVMLKKKLPNSVSTGDQTLNNTAEESFILFCLSAIEVYFRACARMQVRVRSCITCKSTKFLTDTAQKSQIFRLIYVFREYFLQ